MKLFYDLRISAKLFVGFILLLLLTIFLGGFSVYQLSRVNSTALELGTNWMPSVNAAMGIKERISRLRTQEMQIVMSAGDEENLKKYEKRWNDYVAELKKYEADYVKLISTEDEKKFFADYSKLWERYVVEAKKLTAQANAGNMEEARTTLRGESSKLNADMLAMADKMVQVNADGGIAEYRTGEQIYANSRSLILGLIVVTIALGLLLAYWIARVVARPLQEAVKVAKTVASGDLTSDIQVKTRDETGELLQALKEMNASLLSVVSEVRTGTDLIATASTEIANGNMDLSARTESQAGSLEETASSMEELTSTVKHNSDNARQANQLSHSASAVAQKGGSVVSQVVDTMGSINESSKKIVDIIAVIDGIAFQTNILALNAAVEAARAGEQGRGFAVVASEVRNLAQRSASAAKEIKTLINDSVEKVDLGTRLVDEAGITMKEVVDSVKRVSDIISEITAAGAEQSSGIDQINTAIIQMDQVTQQNAALVEEAAAAAGALQEQAANLSRVVAVFKLHNAQPATGFQSQVARPAPRVTAQSPKPATTTRKLPSAKAATKQREPAKTEQDWEEF
ncbi:methyl-accepting chemotaxis protein [Undibacterium sp. YM2]|uniref:methyl-accepting chemotaxis protein n=1 Tax=Undibacterium sp. YM2 TaxID=2058625 RepID=UPI001331EE62|nr:methyl-accepting chemotaxis protein [Undibacterium sp. YM2]BBB70135.1 methyl-accepting chemotaxis protein [Undibacterium sp. YM2]